MTIRKVKLPEKVLAKITEAQGHSEYYKRLGDWKIERAAKIKEYELKYENEEEPEKRDRILQKLMSLRCTWDETK